MKQSADSAPLVKTCQTCFRAKIRCDKTQESGLCDRCLRLNKTCVFAPSQRRNAMRASREERHGPSKPNLEVHHQTLPASSTSSTSPSSVPGSIDAIRDASFDPFENGHLSFSHGTKLLDMFRNRMTPHFPFVVIPENVTVQDLLDAKPALCLSVLAASSYQDMKLQRRLGGLMNDMIGSRMVKGQFASLDLLQALLVHLAWAHYQPKPQRYSQHLHLATSIIIDLRMDRPKNPKLWGIRKEKLRDDSDWGPDEMRAVAGAYYLASSSSVLLQKPRHFHYNPTILYCCQRLAREGHQVTDKYTPFIVQVQRLIESADEISAAESNLQPPHGPAASVQGIKSEFTLLKSSLTFSLNESPPLLLQMNMLELLLNQSSPGATSFGLDNIADAPNPAQNDDYLVAWLSDSILAAKTLINVPLVLPPGEERIISNTGWITLYCGLSLSVRLDILAAHPNISQATRQMRRFLDMPHTLKQIVLRLDSAVGEDLDSNGDRDTFFQLARRARRLQDWHQERIRPGQDVPVNSASSISPENEAWKDLLETNSANLGPLYQHPDPSSTATDAGQFVSDLVAEYATELGLSNFSFTEPFGSFGE